MRPSMKSGLGLSSSRNMVHGDSELRSFCSIFSVFKVDMNVIPCSYPYGIKRSCFVGFQAFEASEEHSKEL